MGGMGGIGRKQKTGDRRQETEGDQVIRVEGTWRTGLRTDSRRPGFSILMIDSRKDRDPRWIGVCDFDIDY